MRRNLTVVILLLVLFGCETTDENASFIRTLPAELAFYEEGDSMKVAGHAFSNRGIASLSIEVLGDSTDELLTVKEGGVNLTELMTDTVVLVVNRELRDSTLLYLNFLLEEGDAFKKVTKYVIFVSEIEVLVESEVRDIYHIDKGVQNVYDEIGGVVFDFDSLETNRQSYTLVDASLGRDTLSRAMTSLSGLDFVVSSIDKYNNMTHRSIQEAYYDGEKLDTIFDLSVNKVFVTRQYVDRELHFSAIKINAIVEDETNYVDSYYSFQVKKYVR